MRTKLWLIAAAFALVPTTALADDEAPKTDGAKPNAGYVVPETTPYQGGRIPEGATIEKRPNLTLIGAGIGIFAAAYVPSVITAIAACGPQSACGATGGAAWLYFPIVGPFITATQSSLQTSPGGVALAAFDGSIQLTGAAIAIAGLIAQKKVVVWQAKSASITVTPTAGPNVAGLSLTLTHL